jgi:hypothetical protein
LNHRAGKLAWIMLCNGQGNAQSEPANKNQKDTMETIHLTLTGYNAGTLLCGEVRTSGGKYAHATYAPLHLEEYRKQVCPACLKEYALAMLEMEEEDKDFPAPAWAKEAAK